jgi:hypothetical protein
MASISEKIKYKNSTYIDRLNKNLIVSKEKEEEERKQKKEREIREGEKITLYVCVCGERERIKIATNLIESNIYKRL